MDAPVLSTRSFIKRFTVYKTRKVQVSDRGRLIGTWIPAASQPQDIDFAARAAADSAGRKFPSTFSQMLKDRKKR